MFNNNHNNANKNHNNINNKNKNNKKKKKEEKITYILNNKKWRTIEEVRGGGGWVERKKEVSP